MPEPEYELVLQQEGGDVVRYVIDADGLIVGRSPEVNVVLPGQMVSRRHARVWLENGIIQVEDLGSRNGIGVNGRRVLRSELAPGDELMVGDAHFVVVQTAKSSSISSVITFEEAGNLADGMVKQEGGGLPILYKAARLLGTVFDLDDLLARILELIFEALPVRRGFVLTFSEETQKLEIHASLSREGDSLEDAPLSQTLIRHVFRQKSAMLTLDAMDDSRFGASQSILRYAIHAAMCAPLIGRNATVGAIYVDAGTKDTMFTKQDLELLTAIAWVVGVAVENARLYRENVQRERLVAIGQATAGVGHCVKNILTGIMGGAQFVDLAIEKNDLMYLEKGWPIMRRSIERIENLMVNMLTFSRDRQPDLGITDINGIIDEVLQTVSSRAERSNVKLASNCGDVGKVYADGRQIYRVVLNLVLNAVEACDQNAGAVTVSSHANQNGCYIEVKDTGMGIPPEIIPKLSQAFVSTKGANGTGLGLACSYKIIHEHGGDITVESEVGKGTAFTVFLPARAGE